MKSRIEGLELTIIGSDPEPGATRDGLVQIAEDVAEAMEQLARAFECERQLCLKRDDDAGKGKNP